MASDPKLVVALEARLNKFEKDLKQAGTIADRQVKSIEDRFAKSNPNLGFVGSLAKGAVAAFTLERAISGVLGALSSVAKIGDVADRVGLTAEQLQELRFAVQQSGGEIDTANGAMERFSANMAKAAQGGGYLAKVFQANGIAISKDMGTNLANLANLIQNATSEQDRLSLSSEAFGRSAGPQMVGALKNGSEGLRNLAQQGRDAGAVLRNDVVKTAQELDDKWDQIVTSFTTKGKGAIIQGVELIGGWLTKLDEWASRVLPILNKINEYNPAAWVIDALGGAASNVPPATASGSPAVVNVSKPGRPTVLPPRGSSQDKQDSFDRAIAAAEKQIAVTNADTAAADLNTAARERARLVAALQATAVEANTQAGLKNTEVSAAQAAEIKRVADAFEIAAQKAEAANGPLRSFARDTADVNTQMQEAAVSGLRDFEDALIDIGMGTATVSEAFKKMAASILQNLARIAIRQGITGPISSALGSMFMPVPGKALGGPVSANSPYMVGERGPELFVPKNAGNIIPNDVMSRGGVGGPSITLATSIDARGSDMNEARLQQILNVRDARLKQDIVPIMRQAKSRKIA